MLAAAETGPCPWSGRKSLTGPAERHERERRVTDGPTLAASPAPAGSSRGIALRTPEDPVSEAGDDVIVNKAIDGVDETGLLDQ